MTTPSPKNLPPPSPHVSYDEHDLVFIDTCIFVGVRFNLENKLLRWVVDRVNAGKAKLVTTSVVKHECVREIKTMAVRSLEGVVNGLGSSPTLLKVLSPALAEELKEFLSGANSRDSVKARAEEAFASWLAEAGFEILSCEWLNFEDLLSHWSAGLPPFSGDNDQFRDCASLLTLRKYASENCSRLHIISGDKQFSRFADAHTEMIYHKSLIAFASFIDKLNVDSASIIDKLESDLDIFGRAIIPALFDEGITVQIRHVYRDDVDYEWCEVMEAETINASFVVTKRTANVCTISFEAEFVVTINPTDISVYDQDMNFAEHHYQIAWSDRRARAYAVQSGSFDVEIVAAELRIENPSFEFDSYFDRMTIDYADFET